MSRDNTQRRVAHAGQHSGGYRPPKWLDYGFAGFLVACGVVFNYARQLRMPSSWVSLLIWMAVFLVGAALIYFPVLARHWYLVIVAVAVVSAARLSPRSIEKQAFYEAVVQIVPVLLLAVAFETRQIRIPQAEWPLNWSIPLAVIVLILAGGESLIALAGNPESVDTHLIVAALVFASTILALLAIAGLHARSEQNAVRTTATTSGLAASASNCEVQPSNQPEET